ncbi:unnamed protein product (macronuclear) [Paramecium tetraurelia]|uniref:Uncharacterized protein n=1 Tax=Paramecium tetraurelia TaxID=5888 RepID=A0E191_PARTE|nr:uncharacterized protein GSPATT00022227001 [Paramecium tetraurelia]CAK89058.1 unnamed protein product [Paramecium tetraurelia]|eukprot:XP_001456455.1 hypothetical protein (macronuclear) [Paramecium tetraurelia strain d4-2]
MDDSFELDILCKQNPNNLFLQKETEIVNYLRSLGIKMKTDPTIKQELFHSKRKQQFTKSNTTQFDIISIKQLEISSNSIKSRRTPSHTPQSSPLMINQENVGQTRKSIFSIRLDGFGDENLEDEVGDYFTNM